MKKIVFSLALGLLVITNSINAQQRKCASHEVFEKLMNTDPAFAQKQRDIESFTQSYIQQGGSNQATNALQRGAAVYNIPVVVHVLYNTAAQNITDAQVQSQIAVLNADFQLNNADTTKIPAAFKGVLADCKINFCLAKRDPNGNATTGIIHKSTTTTSFSSNDGAKYSAQGGDDAWNSSQYLNLWVCNLGGGLLGYAQFPGGAAATDGVVILYSAFGNTGTVSAPYNLGRTATHEVGHWLNLRHIWGDANCGSDLVGDTPTQQTSNYSCPTFPHVTCSNGANGDMFMNYMDYVDDGCMQMFSIGQRDRMYAVLQSGGARASLASSLGCTAPSTSGCTTPTSVAAASITQTGATISWAAVSGAVSYSLQYKLSTATTYTTVTTTATSYTFTGLIAGTTYNYQVAATCSAATSSYSTTASFTTTAATTTCVDVLESNNTLATAKAITANTAFTAQIATATDVDYYSFANTTATKNIQINLTTLPADYDVKLYNPSGTLVGSSANAGTTAETIKYNNGVVGTYKVYVYGYSSAYSATKCYTLKAQTSATAFKLANTDVNVEQPMVSLYPQPATNTVNILFNENVKGNTTITIMNQLGAVVKSTVMNAEDNSKSVINTSTLNNGMYFVKITNGKTTTTQKLVIQR
jgi:Pregnancy-associated plasma protein-A/Secretion system C-terminal sorting domain/Fibronectin type III domain